MADDQVSNAVQEFDEGLRQAREAYAVSFDEAKDEPALRAANARFTGQQGSLTALMKLMPKLPGDQRREFGQKANALKTRNSSRVRWGIEFVAWRSKASRAYGPRA